MKIWRKGAPADRAHCFGVDGKNLPLAASCNKAMSATIWAAVVANAAPATTHRKHCRATMLLPRDERSMALATICGGAWRTVRTFGSTV